MNDTANPFLEELDRRHFYAERMAAYFEARPQEWVSILELMKIGGPSWRSRLVEDLREKRHMDIPWNHDNRASAYMFRPHVPIARDAGTFVAQKTLFELR